LITNKFETESRLTEHSPVQARRYLFALALVMALLASVYPRLGTSAYQGSADLHATVEVVGALLGLMAGFALIVRFYTLGNRFHLIVGLAFFVNGGEDLVHGLLSFRNLFGLPESSLAQFIPGTYVTGRLMLGGLLLLAPFIPAWLGESTHPKRETKWVSASVLAITLALTTLAFYVPLPRFIFPGRLISRPVDFISAIVLLAALAMFVREYRRQRDMLVWWVALSIGVNVIGQGMMAFSNTLYDPFFGIAHLYKVLGYLIPLLGWTLYQRLRRRRAGGILAGTSMSGLLLRTSAIGRL